METFSSEDETATWSASYDLIGAKSRFSVSLRGEKVGQANWALLGRHNLENALAALSAAVDAGVGIDVTLEALSKFKGVKRRLDKKGVFKGVTLYDDFAHHPTAIAATLAAVRTLKSEQRIIAVIEPKSNTMRMGVHRDALRQALGEADRVFVLATEDLSWNPESALSALGSKLSVAWDINDLLDGLLSELGSGDRVIFMSNGDFQGLPRLLQQALKSSEQMAKSA